MNPWPQGPLVLAWSELQQDGDWDGFNLVIHELAHKLDMLEGCGRCTAPAAGHGSPAMDPGAARCV